MLAGALLLFHGFPQRLGCLECRQLLRRDLHRLAGARILAFTGGALVHFKGAQAGDGHALAGFQRFRDAVAISDASAAPTSFLVSPLLAAMAAISSVLFIFIVPR